MWLVRCHCYSEVGSCFDGAGTLPRVDKKQSQLLGPAAGWQDSMFNAVCPVDSVVSVREGSKQCEGQADRTGVGRRQV